MIWVTRSQPGGTAFADRAAALGVIALAEPTLVSHPVSASLVLGADEDLIVTSRMGAERAAALCARRDLKVYAVGDATAKAAGRLGYQDVTSASGDADMLLELLKGRDDGRALVHACAEELARDILPDLAQTGRRARRVVVYRTDAVTTLPARIKDILEGEGLDAVVVHSRRGASAAAALLAQGAHRPRAVVGLSPACLAPFWGLEGVALSSAPRPVTGALLETLSTVLGLSA